MLRLWVGNKLLLVLQLLLLLLLLLVLQLLLLQDGGASGRRSRGQCLESVCGLRVVVCVCVSLRNPKAAVRLFTARFVFSVLCV